MIIDPVEHFLHFNRNRSIQIINLYARLRAILRDFPEAAFLLVMNVRKRGRRRNPPHLLTDPTLWLEDNAGNQDVLNRCDVRLGFDHHDDPTLRVINGVRRGDSMRPIVVREVTEPINRSGFEQVEISPASLVLALTNKQQEYFRRLPDEFKFDEIVSRQIVPRSSLSRLIRVAKSIGLLTSEGRVHRKV